MANDLEKEAAARASLRFVKDGQVVGLGTGSTATHFIKLLGNEVEKGLRIRGIPTSDRSRELALSLGIPLITLDDCQEIDVTVDDPKAYTKPFTVRINQRFMADEEPMEFICNENQQFRRRIKVD